MAKRKAMLLKSPILKLITVVLVLLIVVGAFKYYKSSNSNIEQNLTDHRTQSELVKEPVSPVEPLKNIPGYETFKGDYYSFQYPSNWKFRNSPIDYFGLAQNFSLGIEEGHCPNPPGSVRGSILRSSINIDEQTAPTESEFYDITPGTVDHGNGGKGTLTTKIADLGNKKAIKREILWTEGNECFWKNRTDLRYRVYIPSEFNREVVLDFTYYPDELKNKQAVENILSTINFNF